MNGVKRQRTRERSAKPEGAKLPNSGTGEFFYDDGGEMRCGAVERETQVLTCRNELSECRR